MQNDEESFFKNVQKLRKNLKKVNKKKTATSKSAEQDIFWIKKNKATDNEEVKEE
jgi:hypothetical protein